MNVFGNEYCQINKNGMNCSKESVDEPRGKAEKEGQRKKISAD